MRSVWKYAASAAVLVAAVLVVRSFWGQRDAEWQARVEREMARAEEALAVGDSLRVEATALEEVADSLAAEAERRDTVIVTMIEELPAPPEECEIFTAPRDSVIALQEKRYDDVRSAFEVEREAAARLRAAEARARESADSLLAVLGDRPRPLSPLIPSVGFGCAAGLSVTTAAPDAVCGLSLHWEVSF